MKHRNPIHPGEIRLEDTMKPLGISVNRLARDLHVPANRRISLQMDYDMQIARRKLVPRINRDVRPLKRPREAA
jgi:plasmid maintenance system antidote protein VapI